MARNLIKDAESDTWNYFPSDHLPIKVRIKIKLAKKHMGEEENANEWKGAVKPTEENKEEFNEQFRKRVKQKDIERRAEKHRKRRKGEIKTAKEEIEGATRNLFGVLKEVIE